MLQVQPESLQGPEVIGIAQFDVRNSSKWRQYRLLPSAPKSVSQVRVQVVVHAIVVQQRVVAVEQEDDVVGDIHGLRAESSSASDDPAGNPRVFVDLVDGTQPVIAVGDHDLAVSCVPDQQNRRQRDAFLDLLAVPGDAQIADSQLR